MLSHAIVTFLTILRGFQFLLLMRFYILAVDCLYIYNTMDMVSLLYILEINAKIG
jgi:hypothetical protein